MRALSTNARTRDLAIVHITFAQICAYFRFLVGTVTMRRIAIAFLQVVTTSARITSILHNIADII
jgi:hypothetical protein